MASLFLLYAFLLEYMQSANCPMSPIQLRETLRGESESSEQGIITKKRCFRDPVTKSDGYKNLLDTNDGTYTPFNGHDERNYTNPSTNDQNFCVAQPQSGLEMRLEIEQNTMQNQTSSQIDNPWFFNVCQAICSEYELYPRENSPENHQDNSSYQSLNVVEGETHNIPFQQSVSSIDHPPLSQYFSDYSTQMPQVEFGLPASLHNFAAQNSLDILYDTFAERQIDVEQEDLDTVGVLQLNQSDTGTSCIHQSSTSGQLNISYDSSDRHWDNSQNLDPLFEIEVVVDTALQQIEPQYLLSNLETYCFLSFGVNRNADTSFQFCINRMVIDYSQKASSFDVKTNTASKPDLNGLFCTFSHEVNFVHKSTSDFIAIITNKTLFGDTTAVIEQIKYQRIHYDQWINHPKHTDSVYTYIEGLDVKEYDLKSMQDLYFLFIIYICMKYDDTLKCWVLRDDLWGTHLFMAEFYPCIIWKLEKLDLEILKTFENDDDEDKYKNNIKDELKLLCIIIDLYRGIDAENEDSSIHERRLALINLNVEKLREVMQKHLESLYYNNFGTLLLFLANRMLNYSISKSDIDEVRNLDKSDSEFLRFFDISQAHSKPTTLRRLGRKDRKQTNLDFYKDLHHVKVAKNAIYILAFTVDTSSIKSPVYSISYIKSTIIKKKKKIEKEDKRKIAKRKNKKGVSWKEKIIEKKQLKANKEKSRLVIESKNATEQSKKGLKAVNAKEKKKSGYIIDLSSSQIFYHHLYNKESYRNACDDALIGFLYIIKIVGMTDFYENNAHIAKHDGDILRLRFIMQRFYERNKKALTVRNFMLYNMIHKAIKKKVDTCNYQ